MEPPPVRLPFVDERKSEQMKLKEQTTSKKLNRRIEKVRENWTSSERRQRAQKAVELQLTLLAQTLFGRGQAGT